MKIRFFLSDFFFFFFFHRLTMNMANGYDVNFIMMFLFAALSCSAPTIQLLGKELVITGDGEITRKDVEQVSPKLDDFEIIKISENITKIGDNAFNTSFNLKSVNITAPIVSIGNSSFQNCVSLTQFDIPSTTKIIGERAFQGCTALTVVYGVNTTETYARSCFQGCDHLERFCVLANVGTAPEGEVKILMSAFQDCKKLIEAILPPALKVVGKHAFHNCENLFNLSLPETVTYVGEFAFFNVEGVHSYYLPNVKTVDKDAFFSNDRLVEITFGPNLYHLGAYALSDCRSLTTIKGIENLVSIGQGCFRDCDSLEEFVCPPKVQNIPYQCFMNSAIIKFVGTSNITHISNNAFDDCKQLASITFTGGSKLKSIGNYTFNHCFKLQEFDFGDQLESIGYSAFVSTNITTIKIPASTKFISKQAFADNERIQKYDIDPANTVYATGECGAMYTKSKKILISFPSGFQGELKFEPELETILQFAFSGATIKHVFIPDSVKVIQGSVFKGSDIESITVPARFTTLPSYFFYYAKKLVDLTLSEGIETLENYSIARCSSLTKIKLPSTLKTIKHHVFEGCSSLSEINLEKVSEINAFAFSQCTELEIALIPASMKVIPASIFEGCTSLSQVKMDKNIAVIQEAAFKGCTGLKSINLPEELLEIQSNAFEESGINKIEIPRKCTKIKTLAFISCANLESVTINSDASGMEEFAFAYCEALKTFTITANCTTLTTSFLGDDLPKLVKFFYCGATQVNGDFLKRIAELNEGFQAFVGSYYPADTIGGVKPQNTTVCQIPQPFNPDDKPDDSWFKKLKPWMWGLIAFGIIIIIVVIVIFLVICIMKKNGWQRKETLTESLLTQTI